MASLSVVGTPIGNMGDISLRALETLKNADLILCEDTRVTRKLLDKYEIKTATLSYHSHSKISRIEEIIGRLKEGKNIALVSDAGTPGISDPGAELVGRVRQELKSEICSGELKIVSVPGPSALIAALSIAGIRCDQSAGGFVFLGFLPHKKGRETLFREMAVSKRTTIFYESPHRIIKTLESLQKSNASFPEAACLKKADSARSTSSTSLKKAVPEQRKILDKRITVCRELTKIFEEVTSGTAEEVKEFFEKNPDKIRGEFVVIVSK
ncbi:16S rRNA (cytidine(1402)-2'-O)-methyltransferase [Patescibacteria group bacterium]|nr:16S rRNA (cytidine(1402)-2'-O)-methyltransferase [Patescibacteria group bacterium]MDE1946791.1 16S rRNA (cytidine(1402)-2'-O)-methyltransferase [Patescibacteria group bacterium]MDE2011077.1 16S rRNA (cytidine(1402)-2'-O)-methyltransferase [Patescibacteria group bacterium]MDE2233134.1 16S rRNA (cytidine(1402)-2'-O)-methyltransferase [Patescibacteria group bacterium]